MIAEHIFKKGFELTHFWAEFVSPTDFGNPLSAEVNGQFIYCISQDIETSRAMVDKHYKSIGIACKEIELIEPKSTKNSDIKYLSRPSQILGYSDGVIPKTVNAQKVLQMMDNEDDGDSRYQEFVRVVASEAGIPVSQLNDELAHFI